MEVVWLLGFGVSAGSGIPRRPMGVTGLSSAVDVAMFSP